MPARPRVVDTSAWIEWLTGSELGVRLRSEFPEKLAHNVLATDPAVEWAGVDAGFSPNQGDLRAPDIAIGALN